MADTTVAKPGPVAVAQVAYDAGFRGVALVNAVALALAESNANPDAVNNNAKTGDYSVGYWQINYFGNLAGQRTAQFGPPTGLYGIDPTGVEAHNNAKAAYALSGGGITWQPWKADFNNGRYYEKLPDAKAAVAQLMGGGTAPGAAGSPSNSPYQFATSTGAVNQVVPESGAGVDTGTGAATTEQDHCLISTPSLLGIGGTCVLSTNSARAIGGGAIMVAGGLVVLAGVALLVGAEKTLAAAVGTAGGSPMAIVAAIPKMREDRHYARAERPTAEQRAQGKKAARGTSRTVDGDGNPF